SAMNLPVVTTDVTGCVDAIVPNYTGLLVPVADAGALKQALERYITDAALRHKHGVLGRTWVISHFQPERIHRAMLDEYIRLLQAAGREPFLGPPTTRRCTKR